jgi:NADH-quinone oxidoreductase subunit J
MSHELLQQVAFFVFAFMTLGSAFMVVSSRTVFVSALWLILSFVGVAGLYVLLEAGFLAAIQILVYVGAISVLILFAVMLTEDVMGKSTPIRQWPLAASIVLIFYGLLAKAAFTANWPESKGAIAPPDGMAIDAAIASRTSGAMAIDGGFELPGQVVMLGHSFMTEYLLAFEVMAIVLLVALVGAIVIARD